MRSLTQCFSKHYLAFTKKTPRTVETDPPPYCFSTVCRDVVIVAILCDLLIRVAHTLEYPARVSKIAWVEAVVFS